MSFGLRRWFALALSSSLAAVGSATAVASPASATGQLPVCQPGYWHYDEPCDAGNDWIYQPPIQQPAGSPYPCGVSFNVWGSGGEFVNKNCNTGTGENTLLQCIFRIDPRPGQGQKVITSLNGQVHSLGNVNYLYPANTTVVPGSIFVKNVPYNTPSPACGLFTGGSIGVPPAIAGAGTGGTDPGDPNSSDPCGAFARCNTNGPGDDDDPLPPGPGPNGQAPHVTVFLQGLAVVNDPIPPATTSAKRPLAYANYELWYFGSDGAGTPVQWRPVLSGVDANHRPAGAHVKGSFKPDGTTRLDFVYPQPYTLKDGTPWVGCETLAGQNFLRSQACSAGALELRVFAKSSDGTVQVTRLGVDQVTKLVQRAATVPLGNFYTRSTPEFVADTAAGKAYRAAYNVKDLLGTAPTGNVDITLNDGDQTGYDSFTGRFDLAVADAGHSEPEHEMAHAVMSFWYGTEYNYVLPENCEPHYIHRASSDECAWQEGWADFIAAASESYDGNVFMESPDSIYDLEAGLWLPTTGLEYGNDVEGRVAGALKDLLDEVNPNDRMLGFGDVSDYTLPEIVQVIRNAEPYTISEFWAAWVSARGGDKRDQETMFRNTVVLTGLFNAEQANGQGTWTEKLCNPISDCLGNDDIGSIGRYLESQSSASTPSSMTWNLDSGIKSFITTPDAYDVWVYLPGDATGRDSAAEYEINTATGTVTITVNQSTKSGWVQLNPAGAGYYLDPDDQPRVILRSGANAPYGPLVAEAVMIVPHI